MGNKEVANITYNLTNNGPNEIDSHLVMYYNTDFGTKNPVFNVPNGNPILYDTQFTGENIPSGLEFCDSTYSEFVMNVNYGDVFTVSQLNFYPFGEPVEDSAFSFYQTDTFGAGDFATYNTIFSFTSTRTTSDSGDLYIQTGANASEGTRVTRHDCTTKSLGSDSIIITSYEEASDSLEKLDKALEKINTYRAISGSEYNRLSYTGNSVQNTSTISQVLILKLKIRIWRRK